MIRFFYRVPLCRGLRLNLSKSGASLSVGRRGAWATFGPRGITATLGLPGSGLRWTETSPWQRLAAHTGHATPAPAVHIGLAGWAFWLGVVWLIVEALWRAGIGQ